VIELGKTGFKGTMLEFGPGDSLGEEDKDLKEMGKQLRSMEPAIEEARRTNQLRAVARQAAKSRWGSLRCQRVPLILNLNKNKN
jgi:hypothetical protein